MGFLMRFPRLLFCLVTLALIPTATAAQTAPPADYRFAPGDVIDVTVEPQKNFDRTITVQPDGMISYPLVGQLQAGGMTVKQLAERLRAALNRDLNDPQVTISLKQLNGQAVDRISLLGAVRNPGVYPVKEGTTVAEVLAAGGGPTSLADLQRVTVTRVDRSVVTVNLAHSEKTGRLEQNIRLQPGDFVVVPEGASPTVLVLGEVIKPGSYPLQGETRLLDAISQAGGPTAKGDLQRVTLTQQGMTKPKVFDLQPLILHGDATNHELNVPLQAGDTIVVAESDQRIYVLGRVGKPDTYPVKPTDRLLDALTMAGGASGDGDISRAVLVRRDAGGQSVSRTVDLKTMMVKGRMEENELLRPGDVLFVPDKKARKSLGEYTGLLWPINTLINLLRF
jgi:polysaccharide biosynthesis/export protein